MRLLIKRKGVERGFTGDGGLDARAAIDGNSDGQSVSHRLCLSATIGQRTCSRHSNGLLSRSALCASLTTRSLQRKEMYKRATWHSKQENATLSYATILTSRGEHLM